MRICGFKELRRLAGWHRVSCQETGETPVLLEPVECPDSQILMLGGIATEISGSGREITR